jgi:hypothetical protein
VIDKVDQAMRSAHAPTRNDEHRRRGEKTPGPDVTFRWRRRSRGSPARDPQR